RDAVADRRVGVVAQPARRLHDVGVGVVHDVPGAVVRHGQPPPLRPSSQARLATPATAHPAAGAVGREGGAGWAPAAGRGTLALPQQALVARLERASDYGSEGWGFESLRAR